MNPPENIAKRVARVVAAEMEAAGKSQLGISEATNIPRTTLIRRLSGTSSFTVEELDKIADALNVPLSLLIGVNAA